MYNFDEIIDRHGSGSYKWDDHTKDSADTIAMWVADMDFKTAPAIIEALQQRVAHGIFGYTFVGDEYYDALISWFKRRHSYIIDRELVIYTPGVVPALSAIIKALTQPGDGVILNTPAYNCFFSSIRNNGCRIVNSPLLRENLADGRITYKIDFDDLERLASESSNKLFILCNPHNPSGRVWSREELIRIADICGRNGVRVISDEIHCELTMPEQVYTPYALIDSSAIVCNSPSKAFNTAGLQIANIITPDEDIKSLINKAVNINEVCDVNPFGVEGLKAAYSHGEEWLDELRDYLAGNYQLLTDAFKALPQYPYTKLEATYLVWVDISASGLNGNDLEERLARDFKVRVNSGSIYGDDKFIRLNIAMPRPLLREALARLVPGLTQL